MNGQFVSFEQWVNKARSWIRGEGVSCYDAKGRRCLQGSDFMRARDEGAFPVRYWNEHPILFSKAMILALLAGTKTQTRRIVKPQPTTSDPGTYGDLYNKSERWAFWLPDNRMTEPRTWLCPYGVPGDRLWCRETWASAIARGCHGTLFAADKTFAQGARRHEKGPYYNADDLPTWTKWRPSIFLPRWASRITLEVTSVRVERLQAISEEDARAEGVESDKAQGLAPIRATSVYAELWNTINGPGSWEASPWVWVVSFTRVEAAQ